MDLKNRKKRAWVVIAAAALAAVVACGGGDEGASSTEVTGTWTLTKVLYVSQADPQLSVDVIAQGSTGVMVIDPNNSFSVSVSPPGGPPETQTGTWSLSGQILTVTPTGLPFNWQFSVTITGTTITLAGADVDFDVNDDGADEPAKLTIEATK